LRSVWLSIIGLRLSFSLYSFVSRALKRILRFHLGLIAENLIVNIV